VQYVPVVFGCWVGYGYGVLVGVWVVGEDDEWCGEVGSL